MIVYAANLIAIGFCSAIAWLSSSLELQRTTLRANLSIGIGLLLTIVLALRGATVGVDVNVYLDAWARAENQNLTDITRFEPGFIALTNLTRALSGSAQFFLTVVAILSIAPIAYVIYKNSSSPLLSWTLYICLGFYAFTFSGLRQAIAYGLTTLSIHFIQKEKLLYFLALVGIAWTFHESALIFLPAYWIYHIRLRPLIIVGYVTMLPIVFIFRGSLFTWFNSNFYTSYEMAISSSYTWLIISAIFVIFAWSSLRVGHTGPKKYTPQNKDVYGLLQIATVGVTLMLFASVGTNVMRMADYYYIAIILVLPAAIDRFPPQLQILLRLYLVGALLAIYAVQMAGSPYAIVPYQLFIS